MAAAGSYVRPLPCIAIDQKNSVPSSGLDVTRVQDLLGNVLDAYCEFMDNEEKAGGELPSFQINYCMEALGGIGKLPTELDKLEAIVKLLQFIFKLGDFWNRTLKTHVAFALCAGILPNGHDVIRQAGNIMGIDNRLSNEDSINGLWKMIINCKSKTEFRRAGDVLIDFAKDAVTRIEKAVSSEARNIVSVITPFFKGERHLAALVYSYHCPLRFNAGEAVATAGAAAAPAGVPMSFSLG